jgi:hypothetical protein
MADWAEMFSGNTELGIMEGAYMKLKLQSKQFGLLFRKFEVLMYEQILICNHHHNLPRL